jgi:hypothetical protein
LSDTITARRADVAGNESDASEDLLIIVDLTLPKVTASLSEGTFFNGLYGTLASELKLLMKCLLISPLD